MISFHATAACLFAASLIAASPVPQASSQSTCSPGVSALTAQYCGCPSQFGHIQCTTMQATFDNLSVNDNVGIYKESEFTKMTVGTAPEKTSPQGQKQNVAASSPSNFAVTPRFNASTLQFSSVESPTQFPFGNLKNFNYACAVPGAYPTTGLQQPQACKVTVTAKCVPTKGASGVQADGFVHFTAAFDYTPVASYGTARIPMSLANFASAPKPTTAAAYCAEYDFQASPIDAAAANTGSRLLLDDITFNIYYPVQ